MILAQPLSTPPDAPPASVAALRARRDELIAANLAADRWGAAVGARCEEIREIDRDLLRLHRAAQERSGAGCGETFDAAIDALVGQGIRPGLAEGAKP